MLVARDRMPGAGRRESGQSKCSGGRPAVDVAVDSTDLRVRGRVAEQEAPDPSWRTGFREQAEERP